MKTIPTLILTTLIFVGAAGMAHALTVDISAHEHSLTNDPLNTHIFLNEGDTLSIHVDPMDMWSAGSNRPMSRASNADGLGNPLGGSYGLYSSAGSTFHFGSLIGQIGSGDYFFVGSSFNQTIGASGELTLLYWDSNYRDNRGSISAHISVNNPVPISSTLLLFGAGLCGLLGLRMRNKFLSNGGDPAAVEPGEPWKGAQAFVGVRKT